MAVSISQAIGMMHKKCKEVVRRSKGKLDRAYSEKLYAGWLKKVSSVCLMTVKCRKSQFALKNVRLWLRKKGTRTIY